MITSLSGHLPAALQLELDMNTEVDVRVLDGDSKTSDVVNSSVFYTGLSTANPGDHNWTCNTAYPVDPPEDND